MDNYVRAGPSRIWISKRVGELTKLACIIPSTLRIVYMSSEEIYEDEGNKSHLLYVQEKKHVSSHIPVHCSP